jgi:hypothetical protein
MRPYPIYRWECGCGTENQYYFIPGHQHRCYHCGCPAEVSMPETQHSVAKWRNETFGKGPWGKVLGRLVEELAEAARLSGPERAADLLMEAADVLKEYGAEGEAPKGIGSEIGDAQIVLYGLADSCGLDLRELVDAKMVINRAREWRVDGPGLGQHVG